MSLGDVERSCLTGDSIQRENGKLGLQRPLWQPDNAATESRERKGFGEPDKQHAEQEESRGRDKKKDGGERRLKRDKVLEWEEVRLKAGDLHIQKTDMFRHEVGTFSNVFTVKMQRHVSYIRHCMPL